MKVSDLENKNIGIWGLGVEGKAVLKFLNEKFPDKTIKIIDDKNYNNDKEILNDLKDLDVVIRSPGVSIYKPIIIEAKNKYNIQFITEKSIFFAELQNSKTKTIAITGTKGKTTTATFCAYLLEKMNYKVLLLGNMGAPTIELIEEAKKCDFVIIELSSYQTSDLTFFPNIAILLNLFPEHIDWHLNHENYYKDKVHLLHGAEYKIVNQNDEKIKFYTKDINNKIFFGTSTSIYYDNDYFYDEKIKLFSTKNMKLLGSHNYQNLSSILVAFKLLNIDFDKMKQEYFDDFEPVEHRLEIIYHNNKMFVNDSISTIPETAIACYKIFENKNIYGILGGFDRKQDYSELIKYIIANKNIKFLALIGQTANRISQELKQNNFHNFKLCCDLKECINILNYKSEKDLNSTLILSPASPSYDMYKNFQKRGEEFKSLVLEKS